MLTRIFGRKKSGKTSYIYDVLKDCIDRGEKVFLIVPEQLSLATERDIVQKYGNRANLYVETMGFKRLCNRVFRETGGLSQNYVDDVAKYLIMAKAIESVRSLLKEYSGACESKEFVEKALSVVDEFSSCSVSPSKLEDAISGLEEDNASNALQNKLSDFLYIFTAYKGLLHEKFDDGKDDLDRLRTALSQSDFFDDKVVIFDSFYGFTNQELAVLKKIILRAKNSYITLMTDMKKGSSDFFIRAYETISFLEKICRENDLETKDVYLPTNIKKDDIAKIEELFPNLNLIFEAEKQKSENVKIINCKTRFDEPDACAAIICDLVRNEKVKYRDIAVCARDIGSYSQIIESAFEKCNIPFHINEREDLCSKPIVSFVFSAFDAYLSKSRAALIKHIKTGLCPITNEQADLYELYTDTWQISGSPLFSENEWFMNPDGYSETVTKRGEYILSAVNSAKDTINTYLTAFFEDIAGQKSVFDISKAVYSLMNVSKAAHIDSEDNVYWNLLCTCLDKMVQIMGEDIISPKRYLELLSIVVSCYGTRNIPLTIDEVQLSSVDLMRENNPAYVIFLGLNDGIIPKISAEDEVFSDSEKKLLSKYDIELYKSSEKSLFDEYFLAYNALCSAYSGLYLLYSEKGFSSEGMQESSILSYIKKILDAKEEKYPFPDVYKNASGKEALFDKIFEMENYTGALIDYFSSFEEYKERVGMLENNYFSDSSLSQSTMELLYPGRMHMSPTRLEVYNNCRFSYYGRYILGLSENKKAELGNLETGNIVHKVLELFIKEMSEQISEGKKEISDAEIRSRIDAILKECLVIFANADLEKGNISKRFLYLYRRLFSMILVVARYLCDELLQSRFIPRDFELPIGAGDEGIAAYPIDVVDADGKKVCTMNFSGKVDRVDTYEQDDKIYVRITDYKTGKKRFRPEDVYSGMNLQMLIYLYSIWKNGSTRYNKEIVPAGVMYLSVLRPDVKLALTGNVAEKELSELMLSEMKSDGLYIDIQDVLEAMEKELSGRFIGVKMKNDGGFYKNSPIVSLEKMGKLLNDAVKVCGKLASELRSGNININPYKCQKDKKNSCAYCELLPVCRYSFGDEMTRYKYEKLIETEENDGESDKGAE